MKVILRGLQSPAVEPESRVLFSLNCPFRPQHNSSRELVILLTLQPVNKWNYPHNHMHLPEDIRFILCQGFLYTQIVLEQCCTVYNISTTLWTPDLAHNNTFQPQEYIFSNGAHNISQIYFYCFIINGMVHWTNTQLDSKNTSLYSCHLTECNTSQMHIANGY